MDIIIKEVKLDAGMNGLQNNLNTLNIMIASGREKLMMLAASTPRDVKDVEGTLLDWNEYAQGEISELMDSLSDYFYEKRLTEIAIDNPDMVEEIFK